VRTALANEVTAINPDTGLYRRFGSARVTFDPDRVREALSEGAAGAPATAEPAAGAAAPAPGDERPAPPLTWFPDLPPGPPQGASPGAARDEGPAPAEMPFALDDGAAEERAISPRIASSPCAYCGGDLPVGRAVIFCPHCGQNVGVVHCPSCGTELDVGWRFCITCGRPMAGLG
jgi:hypothetical protein